MEEVGTRAVGLERQVGVQPVEGRHESRQLPGRPRRGRRGGDGLYTREYQAKVGLPSRGVFGRKEVT